MSKNKKAVTAGTAINIGISGKKCYVPCDHAPVRSWSLFRAREIMPALIASFKQGDKS